MADTKNELMNEEDQGMLITLEDENGQEVEFEFLDVIEFEGLNNSFQIELPRGGSFLLCEYNILCGKKYR